jgi:hypothetical protein
MMQASGIDKLPMSASDLLEKLVHRPHRVICTVGFSGGTAGSRSSSMGIYNVERIRMLIETNETAVILMRGNDFRTEPSM